MEAAVSRDMWQNVESFGLFVETKGHSLRNKSPNVGMSQRERLKLRLRCERRAQASLSLPSGRTALKGLADTEGVVGTNQGPRLWIDRSVGG